MRGERKKSDGRSRWKRAVSKKRGAMEQRKWRGKNTLIDSNTF